jgi:hypothetical protein
MTSEIQRQVNNIVVLIGLLSVPLLLKNDSECKCNADLWITYLCNRQSSTNQVILVL